MLDFELVLRAAHAAAEAAVLSEAHARPEGPYALDCGFAWVTISGTDPLARYCRAQIKLVEHPGQPAARERYHKLGSKGYPSGWQWWKPGNWWGQSIRVHEAGARAFRDELAKFGIRADVGSRLD